jgi:hypothetical protein
MASDNIYAETKIMCERMLERDFLMGKGTAVSRDPAAGEWNVEWSAENRVELTRFKDKNAHLLQVKEVRPSTHTSGRTSTHTRI